MPVYVDPLQNWGWKIRGRRTPSCHMFTSSGDLEELHAVAEKIGLKREWLHNNPDHPHYDLTPARRAAALAEGVKEVCFKEAIAIIRARRTMVGVEANGI